MKTLALCSLFAASLLLAAPGTWAAAEPEIDGTLTLRFLGLIDSNQSAKFQEYRDVRDGATADVELRYGAGAYHLEIEARDLGLDDQSVALTGGAYDSFAYRLFFTETPHNYSFGARTFYAGVGGELLDYAAANRPKNTDAQLRSTVGANPALWNRFDYAILRKQYGGEVRVSAKSPFYVKVGAAQEKRTGVKPLGADSGVFADVTGAQGSAFGNVVEMPEPVDYLTKTGTVEAGYLTRPVSLKLTGAASSFDNSDETLSWRNPYVTTERLVETNYLAPDNDYWKVGGQGVFRLPWRSSLSVRASYARLSDDLTLGTTVVDSQAAPAGGLTAAASPNYFTRALGVSRGTFKGEVDYTSARAAFDTGALRPLSLSLRYDYAGRDNRSDAVVYTNPASGDAVESAPLEYHSHHAGADLGLKLPAKTSLDLVYDFRTVDRTSREDAIDTTDHAVAVRLRNALLDTVAARAEYEHLFRSSDAERPDPLPKITDDEAIELFQRRFDVADKDRDRVKVGVELTPLEALELSLEYAYSRDDYDKTQLGRLEEKRHEAFVDLSYQLPRGVRIGASAGYEYVASNQAQRQYSPGDSTDPASGNSRTAFNWTERIKSDNWSYGLSAQVPVLPDRLELAASWSYQKSDGEGNFTSSRSPLLDLDASDDYRLRLLDVTATWKAGPRLALVLGYRYENYIAADTQWDGYVFASRTSLLTGAYADEDYDVHVGYLLTKFTF